MKFMKYNKSDGTIVGKMLITVRDEALVAAVEANETDEIGLFAVEDYVMADGTYVIDLGSPLALVEVGSPIS